MFGFEGGYQASTTAQAGAAACACCAACSRSSCVPCSRHCNSPSCPLRACSGGPAAKRGCRSNSGGAGTASQDPRWRASSPRNGSHDAPTLGTGGQPGPQCLAGQRFLRFRSTTLAAAVPARPRPATASLLRDWPAVLLVLPSLLSLGLFRLSLEDPPSPVTHREPIGHFGKLLAASCAGWFFGLSVGAVTRQRGRVRLFPRQ